ncbi:MAG TPA: hypothetical protein VKB86_14855 [Pyrinomonadaceae bacterium]|nr:hypothetical protein [Pyrinomonadaceae bacterium]
MKTYAKMIRYGIAGLALFSALVVSGAQLTANAQEESKPKSQTTKCEKGDPFCKYVPPAKVKKGASAKPVPVPVPSIQERIEKYKAEKVAAMNAMRPAPKPTTAILLSEMQVTGIFRTPRGYAAMIEATPIKLSYVIYPGETFYDGQLVAIEEDRLVFRHEIRFTDGRVDKLVENKPLRQANAVTDSMTVSKAATDSGNGAAATSAPADAQAEKAPSPQKQ